MPRVPPGCDVTHVVLDAGLLPRRAYAAGLIGQALVASALGSGHRRIAGDLAVPAGTVRGWIRGARQSAVQLRITGIRTVVAWDQDALPSRYRPGELAFALECLGAAAVVTGRRFGLEHTSLWARINVLTGGRLLAMAPADSACRAVPGSGLPADRDHRPQHALRPAPHPRSPARPPRRRPKCPVFHRRRERRLHRNFQCRATAGAARYARPVLCTFPAMNAAAIVALCTFPGHLCGRVSCRGRQEGLGATWNRGRDFPGPGAVPGFPVRFRIGPPCCLFTRTVEPSVPDHALLLCEGVWSGTRRRRGASASAQAGGGTGPETRRTAPTHAGTVQ